MSRYVIGDVHGCITELSRLLESLPLSRGDALFFLGDYIDRGPDSRALYSSWLMIAGVVCLVMGIGNWIIGVIETAKYQTLLYKTARTGLEENYRKFQELDHQKNEEVLRRINEDREKFNGARVKLNFFHVVLVGGRLLFFIGAVMSLVALVRLIRRDASKKIKYFEEPGKSLG